MGIIKNNRKRFLNLFRSYFITAMIPIIIIEIATASLLFFRLEKNTRSLNNKIIDQSQLAADSVLTNLLTVSYQVANDSSIYDFLFEDIGDSNSTSIHQLNATKALGRYAANSDYIKDLCVYSRKKDLLITKTGKYTISEYYANYLKSDSYTEKNFITDLNNIDRKSRFATTNGLVLYCHNLGIPSYSNSDIFIGVLDGDVWLTDITDSGLDADLAFAMLDSENNLMMQSKDFTYTDKLKRHLAETADNTSLFHGKSVILRPSDVISDIKYAYIANDRLMIGGFKAVGYVFLICILCAFLVILYITKANSKKMTQAITNLLDENDAHEHNLNKQVENLKSQLLLNFMHGIHCDSNADLFEQCHFQFNKTRFCVVAFEFSMMQELQETFPEVLDEINRFLCNQLQAQNCICYYAKEGFSYFYLLNYNEKSIREIDFETIKNRLYTEYQLSTSLGIGKEVQNTDEISNSYDGALSALKKSAIENNQTIFYDDIMKAMENSKNYYSDEKEALLLRNMKVGNTDHVAKILDNLYHVLFLENTLSHAALRRIITALSLTVYKILDALYIDDLSRYEKFGRVCKNLAQSNDYENNFNILREICLALCADVNKKIGGNMIKHQITEYIEANYMDNNISLTALAEHIGMNYYSLSKLFKEYFGVNFVSHLMMFRMNKAIEKLLNTNETIQQISSQVGFSNSNIFIKNFKKYYGVTPGEYRKLNQKKPREPHAQIHL